MPSYIVKPDRDEDLYVVWSEVVDNLIACGTRADLEAEMDGMSAERFQRADETGTSANWPGFQGRQLYSYGDESLIVMNEDGLDDGAGTWLLPRANLREFCNRKIAGEPVRDLLRLEPYED